MCLSVCRHCCNCLVCSPQLHDVHGGIRFCAIKHIHIDLYQFSHVANTHTLKQLTNGHRVWLLYVLLRIHNYLFSVVYFLYLHLLSFCLSTFHSFLFLCVEKLCEPSVSSLERSSPLPEGRSRSLRSSRPFGSSSVTVVKMSPLSFLPGMRIIKYLGIINMFFIRETTSLREVRARGFVPTFRHQISFISFICLLQEGGVSGFLHSFIAEVFAMVRAHVAALGGNAVVSYSMKECVFMENPNKNQVHTN